MRIKGQHEERADAEREKDDVGHVRTPVVTGPDLMSASGQVSIAKVGMPHQENIKIVLTPSA